MPTDVAGGSSSRGASPAKGSPTNSRARSTRSSRRRRGARTTSRSTARRPRLCVRATSCPSATRPEPPVRPVDRHIAEVARDARRRLRPGARADGAAAAALSDACANSSASASPPWRRPTAGTVSPDLLGSSPRGRASTPARHQVVCSQGAAFCPRAGSPSRPRLARSRRDRRLGSVRVRRRAEGRARAAPRGPRSPRRADGRPGPRPQSSARSNAGQ